MCHSMRGQRLSDPRLSCRRFEGRRSGRRRSGFSNLEVVMTTAIMLPLAGLLFFLGIQMSRYVFTALSGLLLQPFL